MPRRNHRAKPRIWRHGAGVPGTGRSAPEWWEADSRKSAPPKPPPLEHRSANAKSARPRADDKPADMLARLNKVHKEGGNDATTR